MNNTQIAWAEKQQALVKTLDEDLKSMWSSWEEPLKAPLTIEPERKLKLKFFKRDRWADKISPVVIKNSIPFEMAVQVLRETYNHEDFIQSQLLSRAEEKHFVKENCRHYENNCHPRDFECMNCDRFSFKKAAIQEILGSKDIEPWTIV